MIPTRMSLLNHWNGKLEGDNKQLREQLKVAYAEVYKKIKFMGKNSALHPCLFKKGSFNWIGCFNELKYDTKRWVDTFSYI